MTDTPDEIARKLTPVMQRALANIAASEGLDIYKTAGKSPLVRESDAEFCKPMIDLGVVDLGFADRPYLARGGSVVLGYGWVRITPLGQSVRAALAQQEPQP